MESRNNQELKTVKIEINLYETQNEFVNKYARLCRMSPEKLYRKLLVSKIHEVMDKTKLLPYTTIHKIVSILPAESGNEGQTSNTPGQTSVQ